MSASWPPTQDELLAAARTGNRAALGQLLDHYRPYLRAVAGRLLGPQLAEEVSSVVQDGAMAAVERLHQFRGDGSAQFHAWLVAIVRNRARDRLTRAGRFQPLPEGPNGEAPFEAADSSLSEGLLRRERAARVWQAMEQLAPGDRTILELRHFADCSYEAIAAQLGCTMDAARQRWLRALRRLRTLLGDDHDFS